MENNRQNNLNCKRTKAYRVINHTPPTQPLSHNRAWTSSVSKHGVIALNKSILLGLASILRRGCRAIKSRLLSRVVVQTTKVQNINQWSTSQLHHLNHICIIKTGGWQIVLLISVGASCEMEDTHIIKGSYCSH